MASDTYFKLMSILDGYIFDALRGAAIEQFRPSLNPDEMDDRIQYGKEQAARLREVRKMLENILSGVLDDSRPTVSIEELVKRTVREVLTSPKRFEQVPEGSEGSFSNG